jgi:hypothetical protein
MTIAKTAFILAVGLASASPAFADDTNNYTNTAMGAAIWAGAGAATGGPVGAAVGGAAGAASGWVSDIEAGIARNEETYREGTERWEADRNDD